MSDLYFYDGRIVEPDEPVASLGDRGYIFGDGVYDAWMVLDGKQFLRSEHLDRFERSCAALGIVPSLSRAEVEGVTDMLVERSGLPRAMLYLQWTRGRQIPRSHVPEPGVRPILSGFIKAAEPFPAALLAKGVDVIFHPDLRQSFCDIKSLNLLGSVMASEAAHRAGCHEALLVRDLGDRKVVTECAHSNCYAIEGGAVYTAPLGKLILPGITRRAVIDIAHRLGIRVVEEFRPPEFFSAADEAFISAASGLLPIAAIDGREVGSGSRPVFAKLAAAYDELVARNRG